MTHVQDYENYAIVTQGGLRFIGEYVSSVNGPDRLQMAYELTIHIIPMPTPNGVMLQKQIVCSPVLVTNDVSSLEFYGSFSVQRFSVLSTADVKRYIDLISGAEKMALELRAREAGIVMPGQQKQ